MKIPYKLRKKLELLEVHIRQILTKAKKQFFITLNIKIK